MHFTSLPNFSNSSNVSGHRTIGLGTFGLSNNQHKSYRSNAWKDIKGWCLRQICEFCLWNVARWHRNYPVILQLLHLKIMWRIISEQNVQSTAKRELNNSEDVWGCPGVKNPSYNLKYASNCFVANNSNIHTYICISTKTWSEQCGFLFPLVSKLSEWTTTQGFTLKQVLGSGCCPYYHRVLLRY